MLDLVANTLAITTLFTSVIEWAVSTFPINLFLVVGLFSAGLGIFGRAKAKVR